MFMISAVKSQEEGSSGAFSYGVKLGMTSSTFASQYQKLEDAESMTGFTGGLYAKYMFNDKMGVSLEALYAMEGTMRLNPAYIYTYTTYSNSTMSLTKANSNVILHNIDVPVLFNYTVADLSGVKLTVMAGVSFDYMLMAQAKNLLVYSITNTNTTTDGMYYNYITLPGRAVDDVSYAFKPYNVGAQVGVAADFGLISADLSYKIGLMPINDLATYNLNNYAGSENISTNTVFIKLGINIMQLLN
jgi:hypothetical protein